MSFGDLLDVINPLQHIPVISTIYRELTGDTISPAARIAGDALYGGLVGLGSSILNEVVEGATGNDIGGHIWATLFGSEDDKGPKPEVASATTPVADVDQGMPVNLLPDVASSGTTAPVSDAKPLAAPPTLEATTPLNGPTSFFQSLQRGGHSAHGVPLSTTVPVGSVHKPSGAEALLQAQGPTGSQTGNQSEQAPAPNLGTTGLSAAMTPPPAVASAPPSTQAPVPVAPGNISDLMMKALDQYKSMAQQPNSMGPTPSTMSAPVS